MNNNYNFTHLNFLPRLEEHQIDDVTIIDKIISESLSKVKHYIENSGKTIIKTSTKFEISGANLWIFADGITYKIGCNMSTSSMRSEIFIYYISKNRKRTPSPHFFEIKTKEVDRLKREEANINNIEFIKNIKTIFSTEKYAPIMDRNKWNDFIEPYEYYMDLKINKMNETFYPMFIENISIKDAYFTTKQNEYTAKFNSKGERSEEIFISNTSGEKKLSRILEELKCSKFELDKVFELEKKYGLIKKSRFMDFFSNDSKEIPLLTKTTLGWVTNHKNDKKFIGSKSSEIENNKKRIDSAIESVENIIYTSTESFGYLYDSISTMRKNDNSFNNFYKIIEDTNKKIEQNILQMKNILIEPEDRMNLHNINKKIQKKSSNITDFISDSINKSETIVGEFITNIKMKKDYLQIKNKNIKSLNNDKKILESEILKKTNYIQKINKEIFKINFQITDEINQIEEKEEIKLIAGLRVLEKNIVSYNLEIKKMNKNLESAIKKISKCEYEYLEDQNKLKALIENEKDISVEKIKKEEHKLYSLIEKAFENVEDSNLLEIFEEEMTLTINYYFTNQINQKERWFYLIDRTSTILLDTISKTIRVIQNEGMNNSLIKTIAEEEMPFSSSDEDKLGFQNYKHLNEEQSVAFYKAIDPDNPISIIQGPPGTGKTEIITEIIKYFKTKDINVILSSQSNEAINNVLDKMLNDKNGPIMSCWATNKKNNKYFEENVSETWYQNTFINRMSDISNDISVDKKDKKEINILKNIISELSKHKTSESTNSYLNELGIEKGSNIIAATTTTAAMNYGSHKEFADKAEVLIIDEVSKSILIEILRYSMKVKKVILVGDYKQLSPIFDLKKNEVEDLEIYNESSFDDLKNKIETGVFSSLSKRASKAGLNTQLVINYRSIEEVLKSYKVFYRKSKNTDDIESKELVSGKTNKEFFKEINNTYDWNKNTKYLVKGSLRYFINIDDTQSIQNPKSKSRHNQGEREKIKEILNDAMLIVPKNSGKSLGLIFMYGEQLKKFKSENRDLINKLYDHFGKHRFRINTVDGYQGSESDIIIVATTFKPDQSNRRSFLTNYRRLNVAVSRAKEMLIFLGSEEYFMNLEMDRDGHEPDYYMKEVIIDIKQSDKSKFYER